MDRIWVQNNDYASIELLKEVSQNSQNQIFSFFLIFLKIEIPLISLDRINHITYDKVFFFIFSTETESYKTRL